MLTDTRSHNSMATSKNTVESILNDNRVAKKEDKKKLEELEKRKAGFEKRLVNEIIKNIYKRTKTSKKIISKLLAFFKRYSVVNPSQQFLGNMIGADRGTVNRLLKVLHNFGYIKKQDNGWADCDKKPKGELRKNKLTYFMGSKLKLLLKLINTRTRYYTKEIALILALIPSLGLFIGENVTDTNYLDKYKEITKKKSCDLGVTPHEISFFEQIKCKDIVSSGSLPTTNVSVQKVVKKPSPLKPSSYSMGSCKLFKTGYPLQEINRLEKREVEYLAMQKGFIDEIRFDYFGLKKSCRINPTPMKKDRLKQNKKTICRIIDLNVLKYVPGWMLYVKKECHEALIRNEKLKKEESEKIDILIKAIPSGKRLLFKCYSRKD